MSSIVSEKVRSGMGALPHGAGVAFRVWAPHAVAVYVTGSLNEWSPESHTMIKESNDCCYADIATAAIGNEYLYRIVNGEKQMMRIDSYARQVTSSIGQSVVHDSQFAWEGDDFHLLPINELVIYEMHLGTFHDNKDGGTNSFDETLQKLDYLKQLGVNVIEGMPLAEFGGYTS